MTIMNLAIIYFFTKSGDIWTIPSISFWGCSKAQKISVDIQYPIRIKKLKNYSKLLKDSSKKFGKCQIKPVYTKNKII